MPTTSSVAPNMWDATASDADYITTLYTTFVQRQPEAAGLDYDQTRLRNGEARSVLIDNFVNAQEFDQFMTTLG